MILSTHVIATRSCVTPVTRLLMLRPFLHFIYIALPCARTCVERTALEN
jgi:hypothetical protein